MGPMFKKQAIPFKEPRQMRRAIGLSPRKQDHVMRPFDGVDAVELYETEFFDQL